MRIAGGVLLLLVGLTSLIEGGCVAIGCQAASALGAIGAEAGKAKSLDDLKKISEAAGKDLQKGIAASASYIGVASIIIRVGGLLCIVAGILFFVNKAKVFGFIAPAVGIVGEILLFVFLAFNIFGLVKILIYAFGAIAATKVGEQA